VLSLDLWLDGPTFSLYALSSSSTYFELIFHLGIVFTLLWTVGWKTRLTGVLALVFRYSLYTRNTFIANGGDNLSVIVMIFLAVADTGAYFSVDAWQNKNSETKPSQSSVGKQVLALLHNTALLAVVLQLCVMYTVAGLHKASGPMWQSGTALYYILRVEEFSAPFAYLIYRNEYLLLLLAYSTICFQLGFAMSLHTRYTRYLWLLGGIGFHLGIATFMGLVTFSIFMVAAYPILITDREYEWVFVKVQELFMHEKLQFTLPHIFPMLIQKWNSEQIGTDPLTDPSQTRS
jgi:antimicrobial peptide system SdpB family protein